MNSSKPWLVPTDAPANPELVALAATLAGAKPPSTTPEPSPPANSGVSVDAELVPKRAVQKDVRERLIRVSGHVSKEKQFVIRKAAADRNMSVDGFVIACIDAVLRSQGLLETE